jgi:hypothetical protein
VSVFNLPFQPVLDALANPLAGRDNVAMRALWSVGLVLALAGGCGGKSKSSPMDARGDRADGGGGTDGDGGGGDVAAPADVADTAMDIAQSDGSPVDAVDVAGSDAAAPDSAGPDAATPDAVTPDRASDAAPPDAPGPDAAPDGAGSDGGGTETRPPDPCASNNPLTTVGCNGEPPGPAPANTLGGRCSPTDGGAASGTCTNASHFCVEGICAPLCEPAATEVSTGGCPAGSRCWNTGLLSFCFVDCRAAADCATNRCDSVRGLCRGP